MLWKKGYVVSWTEVEIFSSVKDVLNIVNVKTICKVGLLSWSLTPCLDSKFREKRKESKGKGGKGKEGKRIGRKITLVCLGGKGKERKGDRDFPSNHSNFGKIP